MPSQSEHAQEQLKLGDRIWIWLDDPPSDLEKAIANQLAPFDQDGEVFYVQVFPWSSTPMPRAKEISSHFPKLTELTQDRFIGLHEIEDGTTVKLPMTTLMFSDRARAGNIRISSTEFVFCEQLIIVIACRQVDHDSGHASLQGALDAIGYLSLVFGRSIGQKPVFSNYFNIKAKKFVSGTLTLESKTDIEECVFGIKSFYNLDEFSGDDAKIHASMWFAGKAFTERDRASKIVFYNTAIELICGKRMQDHFRRLYKGQPGALQAVERIDDLQNLRGNLLHDGKLGEFSSNSERYVQLLLLDAIIKKQRGALPSSAFLAAINPKQVAGG